MQSFCYHFFPHAPLLYRQFFLAAPNSEAALLEHTTKSWPRILQRLARAQQDQDRSRQP